MGWVILGMFFKLLSAFTSKREITVSAYLSHRAAVRTAGEREI